MPSEQHAADEAREKAIFEAISALSDSDAAVLQAWDQLDILSSATLFEGIEAAPGGILISGNGQFEAAATVYITLQYGGSRDNVSMSDSYPATVFGNVDDAGNVEVERVEVDTESFYES
jgi:hypothetical protein